MKVSIMQPYFFPYIGYFQLIANSDVFVIYDDVNFIKKGWINRNTILVNNTPYLFSIPLQNVSQNKLINEIFISDLDKWKTDLLKTISLSYKKAPFYQDVYPLIEKIISFDELNLALYIQNSLQNLCEYLNLNTKLVMSSEIVKNNDLRGENKIIDICIQLGANQYINAIGGIELYIQDNFQVKNIDLKFIKSENIIYKQFKNEFKPWLSIIDVIMFNSLEDTRMLLNKFELI
ncbi:WbqC family protein [Flavobacterium sp. TH16-21]|uniref:WbqC family protein n=2 Tax=Flavobacterium lacisediminis TaxID=2989705 RepID=A0ABT3EH40_9FLAO|nr:WbqC family protein [Flavobacterium lacisediminis]